jgi:hypothetical protein
MTILENDFSRANNDVNGNPRYVCHFLWLTSPDDLSEYRGLDKITQKYNLALARARKFGGRKFHNKQFGGGIVFQCYNLRELCDEINALRLDLGIDKPLAPSPEQLELF